MKKAIATMMLVAGGLFAAPAVRVGIAIGVPAPVAVVRPACPGPGYTWVATMLRTECGLPVIGLLRLS
jgi:hypothetical protein